MNSPLRMRTYLLVLVAAVLGVAAARFTSASVEGEAQALASREFQASSSAAAASVSARAATVYASLASADVLIEHGHDLGALCEIMSHDRHRPYQRLTVLTISGNLRCSTVPETRDQPEVIRQRTYFQTVLATGDDQIGGPLVGAFSGRPSLVFAHPIRSGSSIIGVAAAAIDAADVLQPARSRTYSERILAVGRDGLYELGAGDVPTLPPTVAEAVSRSLATGDSCPVMVAGGAAWTCNPIGKPGLTVVTSHAERTVFAIVSDTVNLLRVRAFSVVAVAIVATVMNDFLFLRRIRIAHGNAGLPSLGMTHITRRDEIDALSDWARAAEEERQRLQREVDGHERRRLDSDRDLLTSIAETVEVRYPFLRNHGDRVGRYARQIGARLGIGGDDLEHLEFAARVHDLGKIVIADAVYLKPGRLEPIEVAQMQLHATRGGEIAARMRTVRPEVVEAIRHHHERWDGAGYPDGLAGTNIPLWARVIAVADAYDAMTEQRPYRDRPWTHDEALRILSDGSGTQWDATAVAAFFEVVESGEVRPKPASLTPRQASPDG